MQKARGYIAKWLIGLAFKLSPTNVLYFYEYRHAKNESTGDGLVVVGPKAKYGAAVKTDKPKEGQTDEQQKQA